MVSLSAIKAVLGASSDSVGALCTHPAVNKWSRYKPIRDPRPCIALTDGDNYRGRAETLPSGVTVDRNCGLVVVAYPTIYDLLDPAKTANDWAYLRPTGRRKLDGTAAPASAWTPYRLGDFDRYYHAAASPFGSELRVPSVIPNDVNTQFTAALDVVRVPGSTDTSRAGSLTAAEIGVDAATTLADCFFGIAVFAMRKSTLSLMWIRTAALPGETSLRSAGIAGLLSGEKVTVVPFLSTRAILTDSGIADSTNRFLSLPDAPPVEVQAGSGADARGITLNISHSMSRELGGAYRVRYTVSAAVAATGTGGVFADCVVELTDSAGTIIAQHTLGDIEVHAGGKYTHSGSFSTGERPAAIKFSIHNGIYSISSLIRQSAGDDDIIII